MSSHHTHGTTFRQMILLALGLTLGFTVIEALTKLDGILEVHDLHICSLSGKRTAPSAHLVIDGLLLWEQRLSAAKILAHERFNIDHCTYQSELQSANKILIQIEEPHKTE